MLTWRHPLLPPRNLLARARKQLANGNRQSGLTLFTYCYLLIATNSCAQITGQSRVTLVTHDKGCVRYPTEGNSSNHELTTAMHHLLKSLAGDLFLGLTL